MALELKFWEILYSISGLPVTCRDVQFLKSLHLLCKMAIELNFENECLYSISGMPVAIPVQILKIQLATQFPIQNGHRELNFENFSNPFVVCALHIILHKFCEVISQFK